MIVLEGVSLQFTDGTWGLREISLNIPEKSLFLICGANGSGKSSLLRVIAGIYKPIYGTVRISGRELHRDIDDLRGIVGLVFQNPDHQILGETVEDDVKLGPMYMGLDESEIEERVREALKFCDLEHLRYKNCYALSGGEKKRLSIASMLAMKPSVILLDEPFAGLDFPSTRLLLKKILELKEAGHTLVITSHDVEVVAPFITHIAILKDGRMSISSDNPERIFPLLSSYDVRPPCYVLEGTDVSWLMS